MTYYLAMWDSEAAADARQDDRDTGTMYEGAEPHGSLLLDVEEKTVQCVLAQAYNDEVAEMEDGPPPTGTWLLRYISVAPGKEYQQWLWTREGESEPEVCVVIREVQAML